MMSLKGAVLCRCTTKRDCSIGLNCHHVFDPSLPFGGYKQSGWGCETGQRLRRTTRRPKRSPWLCSHLEQNAADQNYPSDPLHV